MLTQGAQASAAEVSRKLDTALRLETPEGALIELRPAGLYSRGLAFLIDEIIRWTIITVGYGIGGALGTFGIGFALVVTFLTYWLYGVAFEVFNAGVTPGKQSQDLMVVHDDGTPVRLPASMVRNLVLAIDLLPLAYVVGIISIVVSRRFQRLGDLAGGTMVAYRNVAKGVGPDNGAQTAPSPVPLTSEEQATLVAYLERLDTVSAARMSELAEIVAESLRLDPREAQTEVLKIANGLKGA